jgi:hypothetical protein
LRIITISNPNYPEVIGSLETPGSAEDLAVSGDYAYVADGSIGGLRIIDVSNPEEPFEVGSYDTPGTASGVAVSESHAYVADQDSGLIILNINNPIIPVPVGVFLPWGDVNDVEIVDNYAFLTGNIIGLRIVDISDPSSPYEVGYYSTPNQPYNVTVHDDYAFLPQNSYFSICDCSAAMPVEKDEPTFTPTTYALLPPYPNPFNPTTTLSFQLPVAGIVKLDIFDINGRKVVAQLAALQQPNSWYTPGTHHILFDGAGLPSGIYLVRLTVGDLTRTQKLVLMK